MLYTERRHFMADDLLTLPDDGWQYELVEGRLIQMPPAGVNHGGLTDELYLASGPACPAAYARQAPFSRHRVQPPPP